MGTDDSVVEVEDSKADLHLFSSVPALRVVELQVALLPQVEAPLLHLPPQVRHL